MLGLGGGGSGGGGDGGRGGIENLDGALVSALEQLPGGVLAWTYPAVALSVPGLLLVAAVVGQMLGAFAWLPVIRRSLSGLGTRQSRTGKRAGPGL